MLLLNILLFGNDLKDKFSIKIIVFSLILDLLFYVFTISSLGNDKLLFIMNYSLFTILILLLFVLRES